MRLNKLLQKDYTLSSLYYQIKLPLDVEILIPADDPVRLLSAFVEGMELSDLYQTYGRIKKNQAKLFDKILVFVEECENLYDFRIAYNGKVSLHTLKRLRKKLCRIRQEEGIVFVHGTGRRKTRLRKSLETLKTYIAKLKEYNKKLYVCGDRNSYSKTDPDATFMRMKEDAMLNGR